MVFDDEQTEFDDIQESIEFGDIDNDEIQDDMIEGDDDIVEEDE